MDGLSNDNTKDRHTCRHHTDIPVSDAIDAANTESAFDAS